MNFRLILQLEELELLKRLHLWFVDVGLWLHPWKAKYNEIQQSFSNSTYVVIFIV